MDIDCPNTSCVVHWGSSETVDYVQEIGQGGRKNEAACALFFFAPCDKFHVATFMVEYKRSVEEGGRNCKSTCTRLQINYLSQVRLLPVLLLLSSQAWKIFHNSKRYP